MNIYEKMMYQKLQHIKCFKAVEYLFRECGEDLSENQLRTLLNILEGDD